MAEKKRPTGVTILVVLEVLTGLSMLLGGMGMMTLGALGGMMEVPAFLGMMAGFIGVAFLIFGIISFVLAYGLWTAKGWAWTFSLVFAVLGIIFALIQIVARTSVGLSH